MDHEASAEKLLNFRLSCHLPVVDVVDFVTIDDDDVDVGSIVVVRFAILILVTISTGPGVGLIFGNNGNSVVVDVDV